ncbi:MAG: hypothetical protein WCY01_07885 [Alkalispirochaeta sp.]|jgi:hypothetical protein
MNDNDMKEEYDFTGAERGKFYVPDAEFQIPIYLESESLSFVEEIARRKGIGISVVVNDLIKAGRDLARHIQ